MSQRHTGDPGRYLAVLRGLGLSDSEIRRLHGGASETPLERIIAERVDEPDTDTLVETICSSPYGIDLPRFYSSLDAAAALESVATAHGYDADVDPKNGHTFSLSVTDSLSGQTEEFEIEYPDTELGPDNFPAIIAAVERVVFSDAGLRFVLLDTDDCWRVALIEESALDGLQEQFGGRIEPLDAPLVRPEDPVDYVVDPPLPGAASTESIEAPSDEDLEAWLESTTDQPTDAVIAQLQESGPTETVSEREIDAVDDGLEVADDPVLTTGGPETHVSSGTSDVFEEIEESGSEDPGGLGSGATKTVSTDGIDDVFEELEAAASDPADSSPTTDRVESDDPTKELTSGIESEDEESLGGGGPNRTVSDRSVDDILEDAEASFETFTGEGAETHIEPDPDSLLPGDEDDDVLTAVENVEPEHEPGETDLEPDDADDVMGSLFDDVEDDDSEPSTADVEDDDSEPSTTDAESDDDSTGLDRTIGLSDRVSERLSGHGDNVDDAEETETAEPVESGPFSNAGEDDEADLSTAAESQCAGESAFQGSRDPGSPSRATEVDETPTDHQDRTERAAVEDGADGSPDETRKAASDPDGSNGDRSATDGIPVDDPWTAVTIGEDGPDPEPNSPDAVLDGDTEIDPEEIETLLERSRDADGHVEGVEERDDWRTGPSAFEVGGDRDGPEVLDLAAEEYELHEVGGDHDESTTPADTAVEERSHETMTDSEGSDPDESVAESEDGSVVDRFRSMVGR